MSHEKLSNGGPEGYRKFPIGLGKEFLDERKKNVLPTLEVKNTVVWVNPAFKEAPFDLKKWQSTKLAQFFTPETGQYPPEEIHKLIVMPEESTGRSGSPGSVIFRDREGRLYRDIDMKGIGLFRTKEDSKPYVSVIHPTGEEANAWGIVDYEDAVTDKDASEKFLVAGIRTHRVVAIVKLQKLVDKKGQKITISEATQRDFMLPKDVEPVIVVRAFGTKERVNYLKTGGTLRVQKAFEDARALVAQELGKNPKTFSTEEYLKWFAKTFGSNVARIRTLKLHHGYLTNHNITLDARIVDLDPVIGVEQAVARIAHDRGIVITEDELYRYDYDKARQTFRWLMYYLAAHAQESWLGLGDDSATQESYLELFDRAYHEELHQQN